MENNATENSHKRWKEFYAANFKQQLATCI